MNKTTTRNTIPLAALALCAGASFAATAAPLTPAQRSHVSDLQRIAALGAGAAPVKRDSGALGGPKLTAMTIGTSVDAAISDAQLRVDVTAGDKISGLTYITVVAISPDGTQQSSTGYTTGFPSSKVSAAIGLPFNSYQQPGTWTINQVILYDAAGNSVIYDTAALSQLGPTTFTVNNGSWRLDTTAPTTSAGKVLTPHLNVHTAPAYAGLQYTMNDTGNPKASGPSTAQAEFCTLDFASCISMYQSQTYAGLAKATMKPTTQLYAGYPAGTYYLYVLYSSDWASNTQYLTGADFGGETDFSTLFPNGHTIIVTN